MMPARPVETLVPMDAMAVARNVLFWPDRAQVDIGTPLRSWCGRHEMAGSVTGADVIRSSS